MKRFSIISMFLLLAINIMASNKNFFFLKNGIQANYYVGNTEADVVKTATGIFKRDYVSLFLCEPQKSSLDNSDIIIGTLNNEEIERWCQKNKIDTSVIKGKFEGFLIKVVSIDNKYKLAIIGNDKRGAAYGLMTFSEMMGVSPWEWWADCNTQPIESFKLSPTFQRVECPNVKYRGIFINDEDWGMNPWSSENYEPKMRKSANEDSTIIKGEIGHYTHERIFELLLRLKANTFWPAMHECSKPFFLTKGNLEAAQKYGIIISTSHCEPMMRNTNGEWKIDGQGDYDFVHNSNNVIDFWEKRLKEVKNIDCIYTLGMRGVHDGAMQGAKGVSEQTKTLANVIDVQRKMLRDYVNKDILSIPQQFIPYKEVLDCYNAGLNVPDDATLIWCDDNYGYIRHFPTIKERERSGGNGIYYHVSYWGRPHDYLWLSTNHPELIEEEMSRAYNNGINTTWILNVGDIKPAEYNISLFMDMAWNIKKVESEGVYKHLSDWHTQQLGIDGEKIATLQKEYYDLCFNYKPEFLGGTRTEEKDPIYKVVKDLPLNKNELKDRLSQCKNLIEKVNKFSNKIPDYRKDAWFELVEYPIKSMSEMNIKMLSAQLARHGIGSFKESEKAYNTILELTKQYNSMLDGKWNKMMDCAPRKLPVFEPANEELSKDEMPHGETGTTIFKSKITIGDECKKDICKVLKFKETCIDDSISFEIHTLPTHPSNSGQVRYSIQLDNEKPIVVSIKTEGRSEKWKMNVLRNYSSNMVSFGNRSKNKSHKIMITALDEGIYLQKILLKK